MRASLRFTGSGKSVSITPPYRKLSARMFFRKVSEGCILLRAAVRHPAARRASGEAAETGGHMGIPLLDAMNARDRNQRRRRKVHREVLAPLDATLATIVNCDPHDFAAHHPLPGIDAKRIRIPDVGVSGADTINALAHGVAAGGAAAAIGAATTLGTATLVGGGSAAALASGGSMAALAGGSGLAAGSAACLAAAPPVAVALAVGLCFIGKDARRAQRAVAAQLEVRAAAIRAFEARSGLARERSVQMRKALRRLRKVGLAQHEALKAAVGRNGGDVASFSPADQVTVAYAYGVANLIDAVMGAPVCDGDGAVTDLSGRVIADVDEFVATVTCVPAGAGR